VISVTPFCEDGAIDWDSLDRVTDFYLKSGADGLTLLGMMGEAQKLTQAEARQVAKRVIKRVGDVTVVVGVSAAGHSAMSELSAAVM
jgi:4-hydroxy-tetrahydrodipicolinate synthase